MNEHAEIILEALRDYRNWYTDQSGDEEELIEDQLQVERIDKAIEFINLLKG